MPIRITEYSNGPRSTWAFVALVRKSDRLTRARGCTMPVPGTMLELLTRVNTLALTSRLASAWALMASTTWAPVLVSAPAALVARFTTMSVPVTLTLSGELGALGLRNSAATALPPSWPHAREVSTTAPACWLPAGVLPAGVVPAIVACARRW